MYLFIRTKDRIANGNQPNNEKWDIITYLPDDWLDKGKDFGIDSYKEYLIIRVPDLTEAEAKDLIQPLEVFDQTEKDRFSLKDQAELDDSFFMRRIKSRKQNIDEIKLKDKLGLRDIAKLNKGLDDSYRVKDSEIITMTKAELESVIKLK